MEITNVFGTLLFRSEITNNRTEFDISGMSNGIYFIHLNDLKGNSVVKKIVKQ
jgi:hypothetical protein